MVRAVMIDALERPPPLFTHTAMAFLTESLGGARAPFAPCECLPQRCLTPCPARSPLPPRLVIYHTVMVYPARHDHG